MDKKREYFSNRKSLASGCNLSICLTFSQFQPGVTFKSDAYKKACIATSDYFLKTNQFLTVAAASRPYNK